MKGTLHEGEPHPAAPDAFFFVKGHTADQLVMWQETFASAALSGNRLAEICGETLSRLMDGKPVSDRYILGLAWVMERGR